MPSLRKVLKWIFVLGPAVTVNALPAPAPYPKVPTRPRLEARQAAAPAITDIDILQL